MNAPARPSRFTGTVRPSGIQPSSELAMTRCCASSSSITLRPDGSPWEAKMPCISCWKLKLMHSTPTDCPAPGRCMRRE